MKKTAGVLFATVLTVVAMSNRAEAAPITFVLDCSVTNVSCAAPTGFFGTVTLDDSANVNNVDFTVTLVSGTVQTLSLNYTPVLAGTFTASLGNIGANTIEAI